MVKYLGPWSNSKQDDVRSSPAGDAYLVVSCLAQLRFECRVSILQAPLFENEGVCKDRYVRGPWLGQFLGGRCLFVFVPFLLSGP